MKKKKSSYQGLQQNIRKLQLPKIEVWENKYKDKDYTVHLQTGEFTCICPKTDLPDFANLYIDYKPDKMCVELKSFKMYITAFRNVGIFHEHVTNRILDDFVAASKPRWAKIRAEFNLRGGIKTTVEREYKRI
ncbi:MAG: NADPH-dependent 7-cyano-7-deazaguanine reductase QueF [Candidatus Omnitrophica bacterium]|nr:NADPH-dependent 7-cyano-7-deazaguanine reductase QueF [Candidatus Omnitrophota bacterium]